MSTFFFYLHLGATDLGIALLLVGSAMAHRRLRHLSSLLQLVGAAAMLVVAAATWLPLTHLEERHIVPAWVWGAELWLSSAGVLVYATAFCWYWFNPRLDVGASH